MRECLEYEVCGCLVRPCLLPLLPPPWQELQRESGSSGLWVLGGTGALCIVTVVAAFKTVLGRLRKSASEIVVEEASV